MPRKKASKENTIEELLDKYSGVLFKGNSEELFYERIPFGITALDSLIGGGIPKKRITLLSGQSNAGKSYLASQAVVGVQNAGGNAFWLDNEISWDDAWMEKCGVDTDKIYVSQPTTGEECFDLAEDIMKTGQADLIVIDSIAGIVPTAVMESDDFGYSPMAWQARFVNQSLPRLMPHLKHGAAVVLINQVRDTIGAAAPLSNMPGGKGQVFFSHLILQVRRDGCITEGNDRVGFDIAVKNAKTKSGGYSQRQCVVPFRFEGGIDVMESEIRETIAHDIIKRSGAWYQIPNGEKVMGMNGLKNYFVANPDVLAKLMTNVADDVPEEEEWVPQEFEELEDEPTT